MNSKHSMTTLIENLFKIGAIQVGEFRLHNGVVSPIYIDLHCVVSFPDIYHHIVDIVAQAVLEKQFHHIAGTSHAAMPLANGIALLYQKSMVIPCDQSANNDISSGIRGVFNEGDEVLLVEDVITSGIQVEKTIDMLIAAGVIVKNIIVFMDRQQGARRRLAQKKISLHALCTLPEVLSILEQNNYVDTTTANNIYHFIQEHQF